MGLRRHATGVAANRAVSCGRLRHSRTAAVCLAGVRACPASSLPGCLQIEAAAADILLQVYLADAGGSGSGSVGQQADEGQAEQPVEAEEQAPEQQQQVLLQQPAAESPQAEEQQPLQEPADQQPQSPQQQQPPEQQQQQQERRPPDSPPRPPPPAAPAAPPVGGHLHAFADYLLAKNHGAMRHVPPPGLSDPSAPVAVAFALLRLMSERVRRAGGVRVSGAACSSKGSCGHGVLCEPWRCSPP